MFYFSKRTTFYKFVPLSLRAVLSISRRRKLFLKFFAHEKGLGHMFQNSLVVLQFSFFASYKPKMIFGKTTPVDNDQKCKFQRFCPARSDCNNVAHGILSCYKLQGVFS